MLCHRYLTLAWGILLVLSPKVVGARVFLSPGPERMPCQAGPGRGPQAHIFDISREIQFPLLSPCAVRQRKILRPHSLRRDIPSANPSCLVSCAFCNRRPLENKRCSDDAYPRCFKDPGSFHYFQRTLRSSFLTALHAFTLFLSSYADTRHRYVRVRDGRMNACEYVYMQCPPTNFYSHGVLYRAPCDVGGAVKVERSISSHPRRDETRGTHLFTARVTLQRRRVTAPSHGRSRVATGTGHLRLSAVTPAGGTSAHTTSSRSTISLFLSFFPSLPLPPSSRSLAAPRTFRVCGPSRTCVSLFLSFFLSFSLPLARSFASALSPSSSPPPLLDPLPYLSLSLSFCLSLSLFLFLSRG
ncbi:hypothetical protein ALC60_03471 [Trachymyrmex zeteki]|uniref:Chitin-binding type-2 domain-containing protein n=1 Tax=Mycetomoellerius zeteki TaxID=64791 RepID=A0A151XAZ6_9HYME|nr:hypothetical protein ALC60_03471 [Trachymyrmex zeteki]